MCGVAGFFTGCDLRNTCAFASSACRADIGTKDVFAKWHDKASVRSAPRRIVDADDQTLDVFPRELVPVIQHKIFQDKLFDRISEFLCLQLYRYLYFTINLELMVVNPNIIKISHMSDAFSFGNKEIMALHKMYVDEGYHALFCVDVAQQIMEITGVRPRHRRLPAFLDRLRDINVESGRGDLGGLVFTAVSETLITGNLSSVAKHNNVVPAVTEIMQDHARDEGRHHSFFKQLIARIGTSDNAELRQALRFVPQSIMAFVEPDYEHIRLDLMQIGASRDEALQIVTETYPRDIVVSSARASATDLLSLMARSDFGSDLELRDRMEQFELNGVEA